MAEERKPWLTPNEQVAHLKTKGVKFDIWDERRAASYLMENNNYFRLRSYRVGFAKYSGGANDGKYINLDFAMLVDLSIIDMYLRNELLVMTLDIEHFSKMQLLSKIEEHGEDGYRVVGDFLATQASTINGCKTNAAINEISRGKASPYTAGLIARYPRNDYPAWAFMEVIPFGRFAHFYKFCAERFNDEAMRDDFYLLQSVKGLRNACAHNNCIINDMRAETPKHKVRNAVATAMGAIGIGKSARKTKMSNERLQQIATTLFIHQKIASEGVRRHRAEDLRKLAKRMQKNMSSYDETSSVRSGLLFILSLINGWYSEPKTMKAPRVSTESRN